MATSATGTTAVMRVRTARVVGVLVAGALAVNLGNLFYAAVHGLGRGGRLYAWFAFGAEGGIPTWYSSVLLLVAGGACGMAAAWAWPGRGPFRYHWAGLAAVFSFLSADEVAQVHERLGGAIRERVDRLAAVPSDTVVTVLPLALLVVVLYARFVGAQPFAARVSFLVAGALYVGGATGVDALGHGETIARSDRLRTFVRATVEENLEMAGVIVFVAVVLWLLARSGASFEVGFGDGGDAGDAAPGAP